MSKKSKPTHNRRNPTQASGSKREEPFFRPFADIPPATPQQSSSPTPQRASTGSPARPAAKPAAKRSRSARAETEEDALTFERFMSGVTPLQPSGSRRVPALGEDVGTDIQPKHQALIAKQEEAEREARARLRSLVEEGSRFEIVDDGRRVEARRRGVDGGLVRKLRHGELPLDATLDLHGMRLEQARTAVETFVRDRRLKSDRVLLIVHGRGRNSPHGEAVLRGEVAAWLSEGNASTHVAAFLTAPEEWGGEGALCVLLAGQVGRATRG